MPSTNPSDPNAVFQQAVAMHRSGRLGDAAALYQELLQLHPNHPVALAYLGMAQFQLGDVEGAVQSLLTSVQILPGQPEALSFLGSALQRLQRLDEALAAFDSALAARPDFVEVLVNRGYVLRELRRLDEALASCDRAISLFPDHVEALNNRGLVLQDLGRHDEAMATFERALALRADLPALHSNLANSLQHLGRLQDALTSIDRAIALAPDAAEPHDNRGSVLQALGRREEALASYDRALALKPEYAEACCHRGAVLHALDRMEEALASYDRALALKPDHAEAWHGRANVLRALEREEEALASYDRALALKPDDAGAWFGRGLALLNLARMPQAAESFRRALLAQPDHAPAKWALTVSAIPEVFTAADDMEASRAAFAQALEELDAWFTPARMDTAHEAVASRQPFYLAYQARDNKALLARYGEICTRLMAHWQQQHGYRAGALLETGKIRIGIVSTHIHDQSVWQAIIKGWIRQLDPARFEIHVFYPDTRVDLETMWAQSRVAGFIQGRHSLEEWVRAILDARIEALIYPEVGMGRMTAQLASLRLAPVQLAAWGHPETTGLKTIDYYLSAEDLEPENAERFYSEKLVKLPHLGCCYTAHEVRPVRPDLAALGLNPDVPLLVCPGMPFKYAQEYDRVLPEIAKRLGACQFVFFTYRNTPLSGVLAERLRQAFKAQDLDFDDYARFVPWLKRSEFYGLMQHADVFLDTLGFSGFNTAMQAVECALPIATLDGQFMRGRLASGILKRMGMPELVASSEEGYIALAVKLAQDRKYREEMRRQMKAKRSVLFDDAEPVRALDALLSGICRHGRR